MTHPLWRPYDPAATLNRREYRIAQRQVAVAGVVPFDEGWAQQFLVVRDVIEHSVGEDALVIDHVGSTAVQDLAAKPIIDVDVIVRDSSRESEYVPALQQHGFRLICIGIRPCISPESDGAPRHR